MTAPLVFPIGHYLGATYRRENAPLDAHVVRVGWRLHELVGADRFAVWALAHGLPEGNDMAPWTKGATEGAARASGIRTVDAVLGELADMDLIVEVAADDTDEATEFARVCRLRPLLSGIGELEDLPGRYGIGWIGNPPAVAVDAFTYELWKWGPACDSLWHLCEVFAAAGPTASWSASDPESVLARCLPAVQILIAHGAAFLDESQDDVDVETGYVGTGTATD